MKNSAILTLLTLMFFQTGHAQTNIMHLNFLQLLDGQVFTNATVRRLNSAYAIVDIETGGAKVALTNMPAEVQKEFGFDPVKAQEETEHEKQLQLATVKAAQDADRDREFRYVDNNLVPIAQFKNLRGKVARVAPGGIFLSPIAVTHYYASSGVVTGNQSIGAYIPGGEPLHRSTPMAKPRFEKLTAEVFIKCPTDGIADGEIWDGLCYKNGTVSEHGRTIAQYDTGLSYKTKSDAVLHR